jgi:hypothetical protein
MKKGIVCQEHVKQAGHFKKILQKHFEKDILGRVLKNASRHGRD